MDGQSKQISMAGASVLTDSIISFLGECIMKDWKHFGKDECRLPVLSLELAVGATPSSGTDVGAGGSTTGAGVSPGMSTGAGITMGKAGAGPSMVPGSGNDKYIP